MTLAILASKLTNQVVEVSEKCETGDSDLKPSILMPKIANLRRVMEVLGELSIALPKFK